MVRSFGRAWLCGGRLKTRFRAPVYPGDVVKAMGRLKAHDATSATYAVTVMNQHGAEVISGDARIPVTG